MSESEDGGWSDGSADMDVDVENSSSIDSDTDGKNCLKLFFCLIILCTFVSNLNFKIITMMIQ